MVHARPSQRTTDPTGSSSTLLKQPVAYTTGAPPSTIITAAWTPPLDPHSPLDQRKPGVVPMPDIQSETSQGGLEAQADG